MTTPSIEKQIKEIALLRNIFLAAGAIVFPVLIVLLINFADYPKSRELTVLAVPIIGVFLSFGAAAFMHFHMRSLALRKDEPIAPEELGTPRSSGARILDLVIYIVVVMVALGGSFMLFADVKKSGIAEDMSEPDVNYVMSAAEPADVMVEAMQKPVRRAVFIPATADGPYKGIVCAETEDGTLELYSFGRQRGNETFDQLAMNSDLEAAAPNFCATAFSQL